MALRLAVATEDFGQPLRQAIDQAAQNAVQGLRLNARTEVRAEDFSDTALRQLKHYVEEHQLKVAGLMFSSRYALCEEKSMDQRIDGVRAAITMAPKLNTSEILVRIGRIPDPDGQEPVLDPSRPTDKDVDSLKNPFSFAPTAASTFRPSGPSDARRFETLCDVVNDLSSYGAKYGAVLQLQLASYDRDRIARLLDRIKGGPIKLVFDPATCVMTGSQPVKLYRDLYQHFGYMRARDGQRDVDGGGLEVPLGDGSVDWTELMPTLVEANFPGWISIERTGGDQRSDDVRSAMSYLRQLLPVS